MQRLWGSAGKTQTILTTILDRCR